MADTYLVSTEVTYAPTLERLPPDPNPDYLTQVIGGIAAASGYPANNPYLEHGAMWALYNGAGSGRILRVKSVVINPLQGRTGTAAQLWGIQRATSITGGEDITGDVEPMDTNNAAIPSQVLFRDGCSATLTGQPLRRTTDLPLMNPTRATMFPTWRNPAYNDSLISNQKGLTDCQPQVLREGQGLAILTTGGTGRENYALAVSVFFNIGTETYMLRKLIQTGMWDAHIGIFNGVGSGVVLEVRDINVTEVATDEFTLRRYELGTISGFHPNSRGKVLTPIGLDSANGALPSQVVTALRPTVLQIGLDASYGPPRRNHVPLRRSVSANNGIGPGLATLLAGQAYLGEQLDAASHFGNEFVLREGEGIAFFQKDDTGSWGSGYWLTCRFTSETVSGQQISPVIGSTIIRGPRV